MTSQKIFKFNFRKYNDHKNFYINKTNIDAYNSINNSQLKNVFLVGPNKSGKSYLAKKWLTNNNGIEFKNNFEYIINCNKNILIENINKSSNEEELFHIINHCKNSDLKILITSNKEIIDINFKIIDLISRLKTFSNFKIEQPDDDMLINLLTKFFIEKQFIINSPEIFQYIIKNTKRSYENMYYIVGQLDTLSLEKKRQLTIPLIKEIL